VLVAVHRHAESQGASFVVRSVPPQVQRLFEITRLGDLLTVDGD
jgi:anti-anti-sigma regulatory factor